MLRDAHCHFFSSRFFEALARERGDAVTTATAHDVASGLGFDPPGPPETLAARWVRELDAHGVGRAVLIASVPGDEDSVATAVAHAPTRFVGACMVNPLADGAADRTRRALGELGLRLVCLFPAMQRYSLLDPRALAVVEAVASVPGCAVFVHCGVLSVGVRRRLGLASRFEARLGQPLDVQALAATWPTLPFVIPHFGAGFFREALMAADMCPNIRLDTSSSNGWTRYHPGLDLEGVFRHALAVVGASRLLFGSDSSFFPRGWVRGVRDSQQAVLERLGIGTAERELILGGNFDALFPLR